MDNNNVNNSCNTVATVVAIPNFIPYTHTLAKVMGKRHCHVLRSVRDEISRLTVLGVDTNEFFAMKAYEGVTGIFPTYKLTQKGYDQLCERYYADPKFRVRRLAYQAKLEIQVKRELLQFQLDSLDKVDQTISNIVESGKGFNGVEAGIDILRLKHMVEANY